MPELTGKMASLFTEVDKLGGCQTENALWQATWHQIPRE